MELPLVAVCVRSLSLSSQCCINYYYLRIYTLMVLKDTYFLILILFFVKNICK